MIYFCCNQLRRNQLAGTALNGIDYLEVLDRDAANQADRQRFLFVHFINDLSAPLLTKDNILVEGGERISHIKVQNVTTGTGSDAKILTVEVDQAGDFSIYTLRLVQDPLHAQPPDPIDPMFAAVEFSFKVECPSDFDCKPQCDSPPAPEANLDIDYLAKDFASFRRLMLDRIATLMPQWQERSPADLGLALIELLAYAGDSLSYQQDAIATEAYLGTARRRVSIKRHARLVDYAMHDGCNARAWVQIQVTQDIPSLVTAGTQLCTRIPGQPPVISAIDPVLANAHEFFATMEDCALFAGHNELQFYTWGDQRCCLPKGATQATLLNKYANLKAGDVLVFEELLGPNTGMPGDADPTHRWAVRLTDVQTQDTKKNLLTDPLTKSPITQIQWAQADALPFPFCISAQTDEAHGYQVLENVSVARGNIVLTDHGYQISKELLGVVPEPTLLRASALRCNGCDTMSATPIPPRYRPALAQQPLTFAVPYRWTLSFEENFVPQDISDLDNKILPNDLKTAFQGIQVDFQSGAFSVQGRQPLWSVSDDTHAYVIEKQAAKLAIYKLPGTASAAMQFNARDALPFVTLHSSLNQDVLDWTASADLLESGPSDRNFVVETEADGRSWLRFGDNHLGIRPEPLTTFTARYRVGNGSAGNVGAESIAHLISDDPDLKKAVSFLRNPMPAMGGSEPETVEQVRAYAPAAFRTQERAVTEADYASVTERHPGVQRAVATFRWTGSWHTAFITIDRIGGLPVDDAFKQEIIGFLERYRMAGYDLEVDGPRFVSLEIEMHICVLPGYFREDVKAVLLNIFSEHLRPDGQRGIFHPDNFTFGKPVFLSPLISAAQTVTGVASVQVVTFQRQGTNDATPLSRGKLELGRLEIARCANNPNFAEQGVFKLSLGGGK